MALDDRTVQMLNIMTQVKVMQDNMHVDIHSLKFTTKFTVNGKFRRVHQRISHVEADIDTLFHRTM